MIRGTLKRLGTWFWPVTMGILMVAIGVFLFLDWWEQFETRNWVQTPCQIISSRVVETTRGDQQHFSPDIRFEYEFGGRKFRARLYNLAKPEYSEPDLALISRIVSRYEAGAKAVCYVNPSEPVEAILNREINHSLLVMSVVIPGFLAATLFGMTWLNNRLSRPRPAPELAGKPITEIRNPDKRLLLVIPGPFLLLMGILSVYFLDWKQYKEIESAAGWPTVECHVHSRTVETISGHNHNSYRVNVLYTYMVNDREFRSNKYQLGSGELDSYRQAVEAARRYTPGQPAICHVNPANPQEAVLNTHYEMQFGLMFFAMVFILSMGLAATVSGAAKYVAPESWLARALDGKLSDIVLGKGFSATVDAQGHVLFRSRLGDPARLTMLWLGIVMALVFCGIWAGGKVSDWQVGIVELSIFDVILPIGAVGLIVYCTKQLRLGLIPQPQVRAYPPRVAPGETLQVEWQFKGRADRLAKATLMLVGREEVVWEEKQISPHGMHVLKHRQFIPVTTIPLNGSGDGARMAEGRTQVTVPPWAMHSVEAEAAKFTWHIIVLVTPRSGKDMQHEFKILVLPARD